MDTIVLTSSKKMSSNLSFFDIIYSFKSGGNITNKDEKLLNKVYYDPKKGYIGISELSIKLESNHPKLKNF